METLLFAYYSISEELLEYFSGIKRILQLLTDFVIRYNTSDGHAWNAI